MLVTLPRKCGSLDRMTMAAEKLLEAALVLPAEERAYLADALVRSLDAEDVSIAEWVQIPLWNYYRWGCVTRLTNQKS